MKPVVIVGCGARKQDVPCAARHLYTGPLFTAALSYARSISSEAGIRVLSAKYGLVNLDATLTPYDMTWADEGAVSRAEIASQMPVSWRNRHFILLCGLSYRAEIHQAYVQKFGTYLQYEVPLQGLGIGQQLQWLKENTR